MVSNTLHLLWCAGGVIATGLGYGVLQVRRQKEASVSGMGFVSTKMDEVLLSTCEYKTMRIDARALMKWSVNGQELRHKHGIMVPLMPQERLMQHGFDGEPFHYSLLLVLINRLAGCFLALSSGFSGGRQVKVRTRLLGAGVSTAQNMYAFVSLLGSIG